MGMFKSDLFFFDQPSSLKVRLPRRRKKLEDVFDDIKDAVNPDLVAFLQAAANGEKQVKGVTYDVPRFLFDQARLSASDLLTRLSLYLYKYDRLDERRPVIPWTLKRQLNADWSDLTADTQYVRREWQRQLEKRRFSIFGSESDHAIRETVPSSSNHTTRLKQINVDNDAVQSASELKDDSQLHHHRPWSTGQSSVLSLRSGSAVQRKPMRCASLNSVIPESEPDLKPGVQNVGYWSVITFQLSSKLCREKGWVVDSGNTEAELSLKKILEWAVGHLQTTIIHRKKELETEQVAPNSASKLIHYYGDSSRSKLAMYKHSHGTASSAMARPTNLADLMPQIPSLEVNVGNRLLHRAAQPDGSSVVFYPSGRIAIVVSRSSASVPGYNTIGYADNPDRSMLACFTPSGCGCCYREDGSIQFITTDTEGWTMAADGSINKKWEWPAGNGRLLEHISIQLNSCMTFCCTSQRNMQLVFLCNKECAKFCVGATPGSENRPSQEEMGFIQSDLEFESKAAANFSKGSRQIKKVRTKIHRRKHETIDEGSEVQSPVNLNLPGEVPAAEADMDSEHISMFLSVKNLVDTWLEHYRSSLGITRQDVLSFNEAMLADGDMSPAKSSTGVKRRSFRSSFTQSAPLGGRKKKPATQEGFRMTSAKYESSYDFLPAIDRIESSYSSSDVPPLVFSVDVENISATVGLCPFVLRHTLLGNLTANLLKCTHRTIPHISDVEFDVFMRTFAPRDQLIVVSIVSTMCPEATPFLQTLEEIYGQRCHRRLLPCVQSHGDSYRLLLYDTMTAAAQTGRPQPLLSRRHNVIAGMFLIYCNGRLVYCDHIFNGYGWDHKDFLKQLDTTRSQASKGNALPDDFMFKPLLGPHGLRAAWGGEIGGVGIMYESSNVQQNEMAVV